MKRAVSISLGSSKRNKAIEVELLGEMVSIERIGKDGDMEKAARMYQELDGKVDAFGVGGADLGLLVDTKWYPLHSVQKMVRFVQATPVVDGTGLKNTLENMLAPFIDSHLGDYVKQPDRTVFITAGLDRWGMTSSFVNAGYDCLFGDAMFGLGWNLPIRTVKTLKLLGAILLPIVTRLPQILVTTIFGSVPSTTSRLTVLKPPVSTYAAVATQSQPLGLLAPRRGRWQHGL